MFEASSPDRESGPARLAFIYFRVETLDALVGRRAARRGGVFALRRARSSRWRCTAWRTPPRCAAKARSRRRRSTLPSEKLGARAWVEIQRTRPGSAASARRTWGGGPAGADRAREGGRVRVASPEALRETLAALAAAAARRPSVRGPGAGPGEPREAPPGAPGPARRRSCRTWRAATCTRSTASAAEGFDVLSASRAQRWAIAASTTAWCSASRTARRPTLLAFLRAYRALALAHLRGVRYSGRAGPSLPRGRRRPGDPLARSSVRARRGRFASLLVPTPPSRRAWRRASRRCGRRPCANLARDQHRSARGPVGRQRRSRATREHRGHGDTAPLQRIRTSLDVRRTRC